MLEQNLEYPIEKYTGAITESPDAIEDATLETSLDIKAIRNSDFYTRLGVTRTADLKEIKTAYRRLARATHSDLNNDPSLQEALLLYNEAYETLSDKEKRAVYDKSLGATTKSVVESYKEAKEIEKRSVVETILKVTSIEELLRSIREGKGKFLQISDQATINELELDRLELLVATVIESYRSGRKASFSWPKRYESLLPKLGEWMQPDVKIRLLFDEKFKNLSTLEGIEAVLNEFSQRPATDIWLAKALFGLNDQPKHAVSKIKDYIRNATSVLQQTFAQNTIFDAFPVVNWKQFRFEARIPPESVLQFLNVPHLMFYDFDIILFHTFKPEQFDSFISYFKKKDYAFANDYLPGFEQRYTRKYPKSA